ncbi:MAG: macrolide family glycosyltransferase [Pseudomonadota bacterium]|nr:macrolide family glycosyltransferase [Pseudomonadota bacterium]
MGKVVFFNLPGATGHINPAVGIVSELIRNGEDVIFYSDPVSSAKFSALGAQARDYRRWSSYNHDPEIAADLPSIGIELFEMTEQCLLGLLAELQEDRPDYIIYDSCAPWGPILADRLGIPSIKFVTHVLWTSRMSLDPRFWMNRDMLSMVRRNYRLDSRIRGMKLAIGARRRLRDMLVSLDLPSHGMVRDTLQIFRRPKELTICVTSARYQPFSAQMPNNIQFVGASIPDNRDDTAFDRPGHSSLPMIYISLGSVHNQKLDFYRSCITAFADTPYEVVMSVGKQTPIEDLGPLPTNIHVRSWVPQIKVLQQARLFISHGGMNSINESLYFNVPLLMVPQQIEQAYSARRIQQLGAGLCLRPDRASPHRLQMMSEQILTNPSYAQQAASLGDSVRAGGHLRAVQLILSHIRTTAQSSDRELAA